MSVDAQRFQDAPAYVHMIWSAPFTIAVAIYFLWQELGAASLAGLAVMLLLAPINVVVAQKTRNLQVPSDICHGVSSDARRRGVIFKKLGIGSLILTLKPVIGFENSIQSCN